jgi:cytochrome d ubiquinol oxidase subunit II
MFLGYAYNDGFVKGFMSVLNVTSISGGLFFVVLSFVAGAAWINLTVTGELKEKGLVFVKKVGVIYMVPILLFLIFMGFNNTDSSIYIGQLFSKSYIWFILPLITVVLGGLVILFGSKLDGKKLFVVSVLTMVFYLLTGFIGMFPNILLSKVDPTYSLKIIDVMSSEKSLTVIFVAVVVFYPLIIGYQTWKYLRFATNINPHDE